jgi:hypothetical protein
MIKYILGVIVAPTMILTPWLFVLYCFYLQLNESSHLPPTQYTDG